ncbi:MAG: hypothetical protein JW797_18700 [Bradymonadales bacterium]|nr:hypothetical protein [Bradymonadales bacterium]
MKGVIYEIVSLLLVFTSLFFFYRSTEFLADRDYLAAILSLVIGFLVVRASVDLARLAVISRRED